MLQYLHSDATPLSAEDIQDIIKAKNLTKRRGAHPPIDPKDIKQLSEEPDSY
ncbi:2729_t:CDS:2 [Funneliformis caledonium]|uniref:2729_t:CDS:1 n=1 Tax=Funneliformis caledonium TaxID=1117310 RepID=A0A9N8W133_9GLOM|nr:2729_t:CDS:2 [Funneliformis caledonium]